MIRDPRNDPQPGDQVALSMFGRQIVSRVITRTRTYVVAHDGQFSIKCSLAEWRDLHEGSRVLFVQDPPA